MRRLEHLKSDFFSGPEKVKYYYFKKWPKIEKKNKILFCPWEPYTKFFTNMRRLEQGLFSQSKKQRLSKMVLQKSHVFFLFRLGKKASKF
jgi:hypothetical protein